MVERANKDGQRVDCDALGDGTVHRQQTSQLPSVLRDDTYFTTARGMYASPLQADRFRSLYSLLQHSRPSRLTNAYPRRWDILHLAVRVDDPCLPRYVYGVKMNATHKRAQGVIGEVRREGETSPCWKATVVRLRSYLGRRNGGGGKMSDVMFSSRHVSYLGLYTC